MGDPNNFCVGFGPSGTSPTYLDPVVIDCDVAGHLNSQLLDRVRLHLNAFGRVPRNPIGDVIFAQWR